MVDSHIHAYLDLQLMHACVNLPFQSFIHMFKLMYNSQLGLDTLKPLQLLWKEIIRSCIVAMRT